MKWATAVWCWAAEFSGHGWAEPDAVYQNADRSKPAYEDGRVTETVYVWVDAEYGFALRCEDYDADDVLQVYWETVSFVSGGVTEADLGVKLSDYKFTEGK